MIDWKNLQPLPLRRQRDRQDRERLAEFSHRRRCAKHKGRNHWKNWERRQIEAEKRAKALAKVELKVAAHRRHVEAVRAYWAGSTDTHP